MDRSTVVNFGAGPSALPDDVLEEVARGLINYNNTGIGLTELSHRSEEFKSLTLNLESLIRTQLEVPLTHHILFTQGGGTGQFSAVVLNLLARHRLLHPDLNDNERIMDYVVTGRWSKAAYEEAKRLGGGRINVVADGRNFSDNGKSFVGIPPHETFTFSDDPALIYYCENETVDGVQFSYDESSATSFPFHYFKNKILPPLVGDYSSSFMSRRIPKLEDHAVIFAGAQKNIGPSGLTILIVRQDCLVDLDAAAKLGATPVPLIMSYKALADSGSLHNTPPMFSMYVASLVLQRMKERGGMSVMELTNNRKAVEVYKVVKEGERLGIFRLKVKENSRSWMNVVFSGTSTEIEKDFLARAESAGLKAMKGHRSVGGIRVSLYNSITESQVDRLIQFLNEFYKVYSSR